MVERTRDVCFGFQSFNFKPLSGLLFQLFESSSSILRLELIEYSSEACLVPLMEFVARARLVGWIALE